jgi:plasmid stability protein
MPTLIVRDLPDEVLARLGVRAAKAGRSMEAEARAILATAVAQEGEGVDAADLQSFVGSLYGGRKPSGASMPSSASGAAKRRGRDRPRRLDVGHPAGQGGSHGGRSRRLERKPS